MFHAVEPKAVEKKTGVRENAGWVWKARLVEKCGHGWPLFDSRDRG
jgi:hypothetical protein